MSQNLSATKYHYPTSCFYSDFYLLRLKVLVNGKETEVRIKDSIPILHSDVLDYSVPLSDIANGIGEILNEHGVSLKGSHHDHTCPLYILGLSPLLSENEANTLLVYLCNLQWIVCNMLQGMLDTTVIDPNSYSFEVDLKTYLCSLRNDSASETQCGVSATEISTGSPVQSVDSCFDKCKKRGMFDFCDLFDSGLQESDKANSDQFTLSETEHMVKVLPALQKAADVWFTLGLLLGVRPYHLKVLEKQYDSPYDRVSDMLVWLFNNTTVTWKLVVSALWYADRRQLAREMCDENGIELPSELEQEEAPENVRSREEVQVQQTEQKLEEIKVLSHSTRNDVKELCKEFPKLMEHCEELRKEKREIEEKLNAERSQCAELKETRHTLEVALQQKDVEISDLKENIVAVTHDIDLKEVVIEDLSTQLLDTHTKYKQCRERLETLTKQLAKKRLELTKRTQVVKALENLLLVQGPSAEVDKQAKQRAGVEEYLLRKAREQSRGAYITEIESQLKSEEAQVKEVKQKMVQLTKSISKLRDNITSLNERISSEELILQKFLHMVHDGEDGTAEQIAEKQIEISCLEIEVMGVREICINSELELNRLQQDEFNRKCNIRKKENLLSDLSRTSVVDELLHSKLVVPNALPGKSFQVAVFLQGQDGDLCPCEHIVTARCGNGEVVTGRKEPGVPGCYSIPCTLSEQIEDTVSSPISPIENATSVCPICLNDLTCWACAQTMDHCTVCESYNVSDTASSLNGDVVCPVCLTDQTCWMCAQKMDHCAVCKTRGALETDVNTDHMHNEEDSETTLEPHNCQGEKWHDSFQYKELKSSDIANKSATCTYV